MIYPMPSRPIPDDSYYRNAVGLVLEASIELYAARAHHGRRSHEAQMAEAKLFRAALAVEWLRGFTSPWARELRQRLASMQAAPRAEEAARLERLKRDEVVPTCACGCGTELHRPETGRPPRFATVARRKRAWRRREAGLPDAPPDPRMMRLPRYLSFEEFFQGLEEDQHVLEKLRRRVQLGRAKEPAGLEVVELAVAQRLSFGGRTQRRTRRWWTSTPGGSA